MTETAEGAANKHTIPVIDRMMEVLTELEHQQAGLSIRELTEALKLPRTTIYRILNTLQHHDIVRRDDTGSYHLGSRLLSLASHVSAGAASFDLAALCQPFLEKLAAELGEGIKLSVIDSECILVLSAARGRGAYALTVAPGLRVPLYAGVASQLLLAYLAAQEIDFWLSRPLVSFTPRTVTDPRRLRRELARIKRLGWA